GARPAGRPGRLPLPAGGAPGPRSAAEADRLRARGGGRAGAGDGAAAGAGRARRALDGRPHVLDGRRRGPAGRRPRADRLPPPPAGEAGAAAGRPLPGHRGPVPVRLRDPGPVRHAGGARGAHRGHPGPGHPRVGRGRPPRAEGRRRAGRRDRAGLADGPPAADRYSTNLTGVPSGRPMVSTKRVRMSSPTAIAPWGASPPSCDSSGVPWMATTPEPAVRASKVVEEPDSP